MAARSVTERLSETCERGGSAVGGERLVRLGAPALAGVRVLVPHRKQLGEERRLAIAFRYCMQGSGGRQRDQRETGVACSADAGSAPCGVSPLCR
jgi:hypothetical protein